MFLTQKPHQTPSSEHQLAESDNELWLLNRGNRKDEIPQGVRHIAADINDEGEGGDEEMRTLRTISR